MAENGITAKEIRFILDHNDVPDDAVFVCSVGCGRHVVREVEYEEDGNRVLILG